ncbi:type VI secretion system protein ImpH [Sphingomonas zeicaulis]|uniref:type VI secretion system baseplate subunit TssG n=1 Tax=Sphingomonas zeicaulis TaxID=1632740 RepID=UPI003D230DE1
MASAPEPTPPHLSFLARAAGAAARYAPFALLRGAEARAPGQPRIGEARLPAQDLVTLRQPPAMAFPAASVEAVGVEAGQGRVDGHWLGLTGPMGPMPLHLTEFAAYEQRYAASRPFGDFLDLLAGRMLQFFYRAWAAAAPHVSADRPADDRLTAMLGELTGATIGVRADAALPAAARLRYAALYVGRRSAVALEDALTHLLRAPVRLTEYVPRWRSIEAEDRTRLGQGFAMLGQDAVAGGRVAMADAAFRVTITLGSLRDYEALLPGGQRSAALCEALTAFAPPHLEWEIELALPEALVPPARLGGRGALGWTSWLAPDQGASRIRTDTRLRGRPRSGASAMQEIQQ